MVLCGSAFSTAVANASSCAAASGFSFAAISAPPTPPQIARICSNPNCSKLLKAIRAAVPSECQVGSSMDLYRQILDPIDAACNQKSLPAASVSAGSHKSDGSDASRAETVDTVAPVASTATPTPTNATATTTTAPTPTKSHAGRVPLQPFSRSREEGYARGYTRANGYKYTVF